MERIALRTRLKPGYEETYDREHASIPAELEAVMRANGVHSWRIFRDGLDLFHFVEVDDYGDFAVRDAATHAFLARVGLRNRAQSGLTSVLPCTHGPKAVGSPARPAVRAWTSPAIGAAR